MIGAMSAEAIHDFMSTPYGLIADVKMLNFFRDIGQTAAIVIGLLVLLSMLIQNFWCRYGLPRDCGRRNPIGDALVASSMYRIGHSRCTIRDENR
jgi:hypothetical protein